VRIRRAPVAVSAAALLAAVAVGATAAPGDVAVVSVSDSEALGNQPAEASSVSADGRFVAFTSAAALTGVSTGGNVQLYVRDRVAATTVLASGAGGAAANAPVDVQDVDNVQFAISGNGRYAVFASTATNLTTADTDANKDVFRKDLTSGTVTLVSVNSAGQKANGAGVFGDPDVSYDGRAVSFGSGAATNLFPNDGNNASDIVVRNIAAGTTTLAAVNAAGVQANSTTERSAISADGHVVAFEAPTATSNLLPGDSPAGANDVVVRNLAAATTAGASDPTANDGSGFPDISGNGRYVVFESGFRYDLVNDTNAANDAYRRDMAAPLGQPGAITLVSALNNGTIASIGGGARPAISADGARVSFRTLGNDLVGTDANNANDVYVRDPAARATRRASIAANGTTESTTASEVSAVAGNGGLVSFVHSDVGEATKLVATDTNNQPDVLAKEFAPTDTTPPALTVGASAGSATDPSGIGEVTVNGAPVAVAADGSFAVPPVPVADVRAADGAGNVATAGRVIPPGGAGTSVTPRVQRLKATLKGRKITVRFRLTADARVTVTLLRRTVRKKPARRIVLTRVRRPLTKALKAGQRSVVLTLARRPRAGRYVVRVRANAGGLTSTAATTLVVKPLKSKRR
jgi:hypothetical protein